MLLTGASGFIGSRLAVALARAGHEVVRAQRASGAGDAQRWVHADFSRDMDVADWIPHLPGIDVVVNAVGILREGGGQTFERVHALGPITLFDAAAECGVRLLVQISALGADDQAASAYHRSKKAADDHLAAMNVCAFIVQPSLVYGPSGTSARLFDTLAALPLIVVPGHGAQRVQPVFVDDLVEVVVTMVSRSAAHERGARRVAVVGPEPLLLRDFVQRLRRALGLPSTPVIGIPMALMRLIARLGDRTGRGLLDSETLAMLERGNTADVAATREWLGRMPRPVEAFIDPGRADEARTSALLGWLVPLLRGSVALVWIVTGLVSFGLYPVADSYALLARVGITGALAPVMLYGAALLDVLLGVGVLVARRRRSLWLAQIAVIVGYTVVISFKLPEFWLHPYGPLLKNIPLLAAILLLYVLEPRR